MQPIVNNNQTKMEFRQYSSIELSTRDKFINLIREDGYDKEDVLWVASEKIHGSNFSIHYSGKDKIAKYGRRTDFLTKDIPVPCENPGEYFNEAFYDAKQTVKKFHNHIDAVFLKAKLKYPEVEIIQIYGEYFGGLWPENHPHYVKGPKAVQKGLYYTPNHQFMAFDIRIITEQSAFWVDVTQIPQILDGKLLHVPIYAKGTFDEIFKIDTIIDSTIPQLLGLQRIEKNIIQGMVLRPNKNLNSTKYGQRVILKKKNQEFLQKASAPSNKAGKQKKQKAVDPQIVPYLDILAAYVNFNRIQSVVSKYPDVKDRNKLKQQVVKDVLVDAEKDEYKHPQSEQLNKKVKSELDKLVIKEINSYFIKH